MKSNYVETTLGCAGHLLFCLTYAVVGSMPLRVARGMRDLGFDVSICHYADPAGQYTPDPLQDFKEKSRVLDLIDASPLYYQGVLNGFIEERKVDLIVNAGCEPLYPLLSQLRERFPQLCMLDLIFNEVGHVVSHSLFENALDGALVESHYMRQFLESHSGKKSPVIHVLESGVDLGTFTPLDRDLEKATLRVSYIGRMSPEKNPAGFVAIAEKLAPEFPGVVFQMFGEGGLAPQIQDQISRSSVKDSIKYFGFVQNVRDAINKSDVVVLPSLLDGRPTMVMEANASGVPVFATMVGGLPEMIEHGVNGFLFDLENLDMLSSILQIYRDSPEALSLARAAARRYAEMHFSVETMMARYAQVFERCISQRN